MKSNEKLIIAAPELATNDICALAGIFDSENDSLVVIREVDTKAIVPLLGEREV